MSELFDFPIWEACPFRTKIPAIYKIRKGYDKERDKEFLIISYETEGMLKACYLLLDKNVTIDEEFSIRYLKPMVDNLGGAVFDERHPGEYMKLIRREAKNVATGIPFPKEDIMLRSELMQLSNLLENVS